MAKTSKEYIEERRQRIEEYRKMRVTLLAVLDDPEASNGDRIGAINAIYRLDREGIPMPKNW